jgi:hypothetical protein
MCSCYAMCGWPQADSHGHPDQIQWKAALHNHKLHRIATSKVVALKQGEKAAAQHAAHQSDSARLIDYHLNVMLQVQASIQIYRTQVMCYLMGSASSDTGSTGTSRNSSGIFLRG